MPVKHGSGCYYAPQDELDRLEEEGRAVLRYAAGQNPNGSLRDIAGVVSEGRNVLGLMPHPEHAVDPLSGSTDGAKILRAIVEHVARSPYPVPA